MRFFFGLTLLFCLPALSAAQISKDSTQFTYIKSYPDKFFIWPVAKQRTLSFEIQNPNQIGNSVRFRPNNSIGLGMGVYMFDIALELVFAVPLKEDKESDFGRTSAQDIQLNMISRSWGADIFYQQYRGFYLSDPDSPLPASGAYPQRADFTTQNIGITGTYIFNHNKYSLRSSYNFADRQLKNAGSFLLVGTYNDFKLSADSVILNQHYAARVGLTANVVSMNYQTVSIAPGYGYNLVWKKFFVSGLAAFGPAIQWLGYHDDMGSGRSVNKLNTFVDLRIAAGYSNDRFFTGITFISQARNVTFENIQFSNTSSTYRILFGWRFQEFGILKKSAKDLLPPWGKK